MNDNDAMVVTAMIMVWSLRKWILFQVMFVCCFVLEHQQPMMMMMMLTLMLVNNFK